ncbi:hypothetical protein WICMUC_003931 [Wickerhamomyces mucosus]|uniref:Uncharacterized protein n=1 Tax=Wickerhamomyces mucosus TaxID=1378264 RepID=A0A9P8TB61_9ASCO|nr:hypothetical protein WICMUC_003931 [Wickerhamomyces mucosus]
MSSLNRNLIRFQIRNVSFKINNSKVMKFFRSKLGQYQPLIEVEENNSNNSYKAWYWNYIPHLREVEDFDSVSNDQGSIYSLKSNTEPENLEVTPDNFEFRDESNRSFWRKFDEYEYRIPDRERAKKSAWRWFDKDTSVEERKLVTKLDLLIITFAIISYWSKRLDSENLNQAYISGMKEAIGMKGNDLSNTVSLHPLNGSII